jgi:antitoxin (DNA-binding transcriptional repressor) of toxin-antitoxin stability system
MSKYKMAHAKMHLATLIKAAVAGDEVIIAKGDTPLVRLVPVQRESASTKRTGGDLEGRLTLPDEFFAPMNEEDAAAWGL